MTSEIIKIAGKIGVITLADARREYFCDCRPGEFVARWQAEDGSDQFPVTVAGSHETPGKALAEAAPLLDDLALVDDAGRTLRERGEVYVLCVVPCLH